MRWLVRTLVGTLCAGIALSWAPAGAPAQPTAVTFAAAGDHGSSSHTTASLGALAGSGASFYLALGDLSYGRTGQESLWCDLVKNQVGPTYPFELVAGNHEDDARVNGFIGDFAACLPDRMGSTGRYGAEYSFDSGNLLRIILIAPGLTIGGESYRYVRGSSHYDWLARQIDDARRLGIPWVVVGMHEVCISAGVKSCEVGADLMDLLISKRVDLVLQGHDHDYQRSKQLTCASANAFVSACVADDGSDGRYTKGAGPVFVVAGAFGQSLYAIDPADPEAGYFATWMGSNVDPTYGFVRVTVSAAELSAEYVATSGGTFADHFTIGPEFELIGVHPEAAAQPTALGQIVASLFGWRGQLYTGYGDTNANTGPISVTSWDPAAGAFRSHWVSQTEAIYSYRAIGGRLYAPAIDAHVPPNDYAVGEPWEDRGPVNSWHAFDMATLTGTDLWLVGSQGSDAVAWRSLDGGATWVEVRRVPPKANGFVRFYFAGVYRGKLYLHPVDTNGTSPASLVFDGTAWTDGPNLLPLPSAEGWRPTRFAGRMVYQTRQPVIDAGAQLLAFDGRQVTLPLAQAIHDFTVSGSALFALTTGGAVLRTTDLVSWSPIATAPPGSRSIGTVGGRLYVGTADSRLYRFREPLPRAARLVTGAGPGGGPHVRTFTPSGAPTATSFFAYDPAFAGGVFVATGSLDGIGEGEIVTGAGAGGGPHVRTFRMDGADFGVGFMAYDPAFTGGVRVASGDVDGDGRAEIVTAPGPGGGPHVRVFTLTPAGARVLTEFFAYDPAFTGGVFVACGDIDGDGVDEIVTGADAGGGPHVRVWKVGAAGAVEVAGFMAYVPAFAGGVRVAALDVDGDGQAEILTGAGPGDGPHVRALRLRPGTGAVEPVLELFAYAPGFAGGVFVAGADLGYPVGRAIVTGAGPGGGPHVRVFSPTLGETASFYAYDPGFGGGVTVAGED